MGLEKRKERGKMSEHEIYEEIALHMQRNFPNVIYRFDLAADLKLTPGQARKHKKLHPHRGYPDLFIAQPRFVKYSPGVDGFGLFLEIKKDGESPWRKDGKLKSDKHINEQFDTLRELREKGYVAEFAVGLDEAKRLINKYLTGSEQIKDKVEF